MGYSGAKRQRTEEETCRTLPEEVPPLALAVFAAGAAAQDYPTRPVKIIAPNPPGGGFDFVARVAAERLSQLLGQQFIVENRVGGGTVVGTTAAARSAPDGYTLVVGGLSNIALNPGLYKELPYDPRWISRRSG